jgi:hypothetical protein
MLIASARIPMRNGHSKAISKATIKPLIAIDYWTADSNGLEFPAAMVTARSGMIDCLAVSIAVGQVIAAWRQ